MPSRCESDDLQQRQRMRISFESACNLQALLHACNTIALVHFPRLLFLLCSDLGVHFDGFIATVAHTHVVAGDADITGARADAIAAAYTAAEAAVRLIKPGNTNTQVTEAIAKVCSAFGVNPMAGVLMHRMEQ